MQLIEKTCNHIWNQNKYKVAKDPPRLKTQKKNEKQKETKSKSLSKSKSGELRFNFTSRINYHHEALELVLIIKPVDLLKVQVIKYLQIVVSKSSSLTILLTF